MLSKQSKLFRQIIGFTVQVVIPIGRFAFVHRQAMDFSAFVILMKKLILEIQDGRLERKLVRNHSLYHFLNQLELTIICCIDLVQKKKKKKKEEGRRKKRRKGFGKR